MKWTEVVFWTAFSLLILYIILKGIGFIKSPEWVELSPFAMIALMILVIRGEIRKEINTAINTAIKPLKKSIDAIEKRLSKQEGRIETILNLSKRKR